MLKTSGIAQEVGQSLGVTQEPRSPTRLRNKPTLPFEISPSSTSGFSPSSVPPSPASPKLSSTSGCSPSVPLSPASPKLSSTSGCSPSVPLSPVGLKLSSTSGPAPLLPLDLMFSSPSTSLFSSSKSQMPLSPPAPRLPALSSSPPGSLPSSPSSISILERLIKTCPVWLQLGITQERATLILEKEIPGIFLVRKTPSLKKMVLSVRLSDQEGVPKVQDLLIKEEQSFIYLESSVLVFDDIFKLIAFYCLSRDILPFTLRLPQAIVQATRFDDMEMISSLGSGFWSSSLNKCAETRKGCSESPGCHCQAKGRSCEIELSAGNDRLWYVNPVFVGEYCNSLPHSPPIARSQSLTTPGQAQPRYKRPPPLPPRPHPLEELLIGVKPTKDRAPGSPMSSDPLCTPLPPPQTTAEVSTEEENCNRSSVGKSAQFLPCNSVQGGPVGPPLQGDPVQQPLPLRCIPPVPPRRRQSEKSSKGPPTSDEEIPVSKDGAQPNTVPVATLICLDDTPMSAKALVGEVSPAPMRPTRPVRPGSTKDVTAATAPVTKMGPVPPPRRKWVSQNAPAAPSLEAGEPHPLSIPPETLSTPTPTHRCITAAGLISTDVSLYSPEGGHAQVDHDSYSTSSAEEEAADVASAVVVSGKRNSSIMLDRAKQRLSIVNLSHIFTSFMSTDRKLKKRIVELALDRDSYMGNLVRDYKTFTLETMQKHSSSTEMLQEIRLMMTQLKNYLIQSTELQTLLEPAGHPEEKLEAIIEAALCKSVLKPLREAVFVRLRDIHTQDDSLKRLRDNQQVVLTTTTTDLGIITSVPEAPAMEKIQAKLAALHKEYSPEKKVSILLKTSKIIYESMSVGSAGKSHGADDFLPVLMYVLARSNTSALLLDVEYMMELMDPALQLGEGSYYLTTTYGALEHIKNYDKLEGTGQLSLEIQDSIHRWERRRTLNKARASRSTLQDFINVSFLEAGTNTKTLGVRPGTTTQDLSAQCAKKFDVMDPESYRLCVLVEGLYQPLAEEELPLSVKSSLHYSEPRKEYYFVYRPGPWGNEAVLSQDPNQSDNLI